MSRPRLATVLVAALVSLVSWWPALAAEGGSIPDGLHVSYQNGMIQVTAKERSVKEILEAVASRAGFALEGADLLPQDRISILLDARPARSEVPNLLNLAPKLNYVVIYADALDARSRIVRVALYPREGNPGVASVSGGSIRSGGSSYTPPPPPPPLPSFPNNAVPQYIPPETPPVYIPPESPPIYIPPDSPPQYIPADGPPVYIPPAPPPGGENPDQGLQ